MTPLAATEKCGMLGLASIVATNAAQSHEREGAVNQTDVE
jgi:hypothetical protein